MNDTQTTVYILLNGRNHKILYIGLIAETKQYLIFKSYSKTPGICSSNQQLVH